MKFLIDTHTFLWFVNDSQQLSNYARSLMESDVDLLISSASLWEIAIKVSIGKLTLRNSFHTFIPQQLTINDIEIIYPTIDHLTALSQLPFHHRDPFDRLMIAQAIVENIPIITRDSAFNLYEIECIWD